MPSYAPSLASIGPRICFAFRAATARKRAEKGSSACRLRVIVGRPWKRTNFQPSPVFTRIIAERKSRIYGDVMAERSRVYLAFISSLSLRSPGPVTLTKSFPCRNANEVSRKTVQRSTDRNTAEGFYPLNSIDRPRIEKTQANVVGNNSGISKAMPASILNVH